MQGVPLYWICTFSGPRSNLESFIAFLSCLFSLSNLWNPWSFFLSSFFLPSFISLSLTCLLALMILNFWKVLPSSYFVECPLIWLDELKYFWQDHNWSDVMTFILFCASISEGMWSQFVSFLIILLLSTWKRCCMPGFFTFVINKYLVGRYFETV